MALTNALKCRCPSCGRKLRVSERKQGRKVRCPSCRGEFTASEGDAASSASLEAAQSVALADTVSNSDSRAASVLSGPANAGSQEPVPGNVRHRPFEKCLAMLHSWEWVQVVAGSTLFRQSVPYLGSVVVHCVLLSILALIVYPIFTAPQSKRSVTTLDCTFSVVDSTEMPAIVVESSDNEATSLNHSAAQRFASTQAGFKAADQPQQLLAEGPSVLRRQILSERPSRSRFKDEEMASHVAISMKTMPMHKHRGETRVGQVDGVDRAAGELASKLGAIASDGNATVVWMLDQSLSMQQDVKRLAKGLVGALREIEKNSRYDVQHYVTAFGRDIRLLQRATKDGQKVARAIHNLPSDPAGVENTFQAVEWCIETLFKAPRWKRELERQKLLIVWTDESGDDYARLEHTIQQCLHANVRVDVIGPSAVLGAQTGFTAFRHPEDGRTYHLPVHRGPDSAYPQKLNLGYWFRSVPSGYDESFRGPFQGTSPVWHGGSDLQALLSGFSPYALTRLTRETGGQYTIYDRVGDRAPFQLDAIREYMPDYRSLQEIGYELNQRPLRQIILASAAVTWKSQFTGKPQPDMSFPLRFGWEDGASYQAGTLRNHVTREVQPTPRSKMPSLFLHVPPLCPNFSRPRNMEIRVRNDSSVRKALARKHRDLRRLLLMHQSRRRRTRRHPVEIVIRLKSPSLTPKFVCRCWSRCTDRSHRNAGVRGST